MYQTTFHLNMALNYLRSAKKIPDRDKEKLYKEIEALLKKAEALKEEWK